jgi:hypothetical protein
MHLRIGACERPMALLLRLDRWVVSDLNVGFSRLGTVMQHLWFQGGTAPNYWSVTLTRAQLGSELNCVMSAARRTVSNPRSFWNTTPSWLTIKLMIPDEA